MVMEVLWGSGLGYLNVGCCPNSKEGVTSHSTLKQPRFCLTA
jgi:hypothetical protein